MTRIAIFLGLGLAAIVQAQDQCVAVAKSIPPCAVSRVFCHRSPLLNVDE